MESKRTFERLSGFVRVLWYGSLAALVLLTMGIGAATVSATSPSSRALQTLPTRPAPPPPTSVPPASKPAPQPPAAVPPPPEPTAASPLGSQPVELEPSIFQITFAELGYGERVLNSPYSSAKYMLRLPMGWELRDESFVELDLSYRYSYGGASEIRFLPLFFGDIIVDVDGQTQSVFPITEAVVEHSLLRVDLPPSLLNDPARRAHTVQVFLDAGHICEVPHSASVVIHPSSLFSLSYDQLPITADLALYPRPFYQRAFEPDQIRFVLPASPAEEELAGAVAIAAKMGDLTSGMVISGTTDLELMARLEMLKAGETLHEHLIVVGSPETNAMILELNRLGALPVPLRERQLRLVSEGPAAVASGGTLTYTLTLTNTTQQAISSLSLVDTLPNHTRLVTCSPPCTEGTEEGEVSWSVSSLEPGEAVKYTLELGLSQAITDSVVENMVTLLDAMSAPLNVNTLTTTVRSAGLPESGPTSSASGRSRYFFVTGGRAVPENDGVVQELASPWDPTRAVLVITGLSEGAVYKASRAMGSESLFPGMKGSFALVQEVRPLPESPPEPQTTEVSFADLGYDDRLLEGRSLAINYFFHIPFSWRMTEDAFLKLHFSHSQLVNYGRSSLSVLFNSHPIATVALSDETSLGGQLQVGLPPSQVNPGRNRISIQAEMRPVDECAPLDTWLFIDSASLIHLDHSEQSGASFDLDLYPYPFDQRSDLADVLFALPPEPRLEEWQAALKLVAALGSAGGSNLVPMLACGATWSEAELAEYHIIAVGCPLRNPMLRQVNSQLPQPFQPDSNEIEQRLDRVVFRLPPGLNLGLVQLLPSPWNEERAFLAVTGSTDEGIRGSVDVLINRYWALEGNLAFIRDGEVETIDTRRLMRSAIGPAVATAVPAMTSVGTSTGTPLPQPGSTPVVSSSQSDSSRAGLPRWIVSLIGLNVLIVTAIIVFVLWRARKNRM